MQSWTRWSQQSERHQNEFAQDTLKISSVHSEAEKPDSMAPSAIAKKQIIISGAFLYSDLCLPKATNCLLAAFAGVRTRRDASCQKDYIFFVSFSFFSANCSSSEGVMPNPLANRQNAAIVMFRLPFSISEMYVRCRPHDSAKSSCEKCCSFLFAVTALPRETNKLSKDSLFIARLFEAKKIQD